MAHLYSYFHFPPPYHLPFLIPLSHWPVVRDPSLCAYFSTLYLFLCTLHHVNETDTIWYLNLCVCFISLNIIFLQTFTFISNLNCLQMHHFPANVSNVMFFYCWIVFCYIYCIFFIQLCIDGYTDCFNNLATMSCVAFNISNRVLL